MDTINPWLDSAEVRRLAERLMNQSHAPFTPPLNPHFDQVFVGFEADSSPPPQIILDSIPQPLIGSKIQPSTVSQLPVIEMTSPDQIQLFRDWVNERFLATEIFIIGQSGTVIFDESKNKRFHFIAHSLASASLRAGNLVGNVRLKINARETLEIIPVETIRGFVALGLLVTESLSSESVLKIMRALFQLPYHQE
jgi:hypothetical protein